MWPFSFIFLYIQCSFQVKAGERKDSLPRVKRYKNHLSLAPNFTQVNLNSTLFNKQTKSKIDYKPATATRFGIAFDYKWIGFELFTRLPFNEKKEKITANNSGIYLRINKSKFWANGIYQRFGGFYWSNPDQIAKSELSPGSFPLRPDLKSSVLQVHSNYIFSPHRFSNMAAQGENESQPKSGGSFLQDWDFGDCE